MVSVLLTGASGRIGRTLASRLDDLCSEPAEVFLLENKTQLPSLPRFSKARLQVIGAESLDAQHYDVALHLAAIADTSYCQKPENREEVRAVNVGFTEKICGLAEKVLFISTDNVFKGDKDAPDYKESDKTNPCSYYGETKAAAEQIVLRNDGAVIRIQYLLGAPNRIVDKAISEIRGEPGKYYPLWNDTYSRPAHFEDLLAVMRAVAFSWHTGIYHVSCEGEPLSRAQMGEKILLEYKRAGLPTSIDTLPGEPCSIPHFPRRLVLDTEKTQRDLGIKF